MRDVVTNPLLLEAHQVRYLLRCAEKDRRIWRQRYDSGVSHGAIERRDAAQRQLELLDILIVKLSRWIERFDADA